MTLMNPSDPGDLGITAESVEREPDGKLHLAQSWGCVLLLGKADVLLAERTGDGIERNPLISGQPLAHRILPSYSKVCARQTNRISLIWSSNKNHRSFPRCTRDPKIQQQALEETHKKRRGANICDPGNKTFRRNRPSLPTF